VGNPTRKLLAPINEYPNNDVAKNKSIKQSYLWWQKNT
jgi:hypothetical protein